ncbi:MAG TPA: TetR family transcriptional regulator [Jiangellaceae bacterium]|nr:TetR family transcriptional regulator [Jiangellaceae bacterium]
MTEYPDWRERKKARTRRTIQEHAVRLFAEQGYDATTVNQIAAAAGVSHMTFFRYFPTKEDVVLTDDYDPMLASLIRQRPTDEPVVDSIQAAIAEGFRQVYEADRATILERVRLLLSTPALRARLWENQLATQQMFAEALRGRGTDPFEIRVLAAASLAALTTAIVAWAESGPDAELPSLIDDAFTVLRDRLAAAPAATAREEARPWAST